MLLNDMSQSGARAFALGVAALVFSGMAHAQSDEDMAEMAFATSATAAGVAQACGRKVPAMATALQTAFERTPLSIDHIEPEFICDDKALCNHVKLNQGYRELRATEAARAPGVGLGYCADLSATIAGMPLFDDKGSFDARREDFKRSVMKMVVFFREHAPLEGSGGG